MNKFFASRLNTGVVFVLAFSTLATSSYAALPEAATAALGAATTGVTDSSAAAWVPVGAAMAAGVIFKLVKRFFNKI